MFSKLSLSSLPGGSTAVPFPAVDTELDLRRRLAVRTNYLVNVDAFLSALLTLNGSPVIIL